MMAQHDLSDETLRSLERGEPAAIEKAYDRFAEHLLRLAARQIGEHLKSQFDAEDVRQSAFGSFVRLLPNGNCRFDHSGRVWSLLRTILLNKIRRKSKGLKAAGGIEIDQIVGRNPKHEEAVEVADAVDRVLTAFKPDERRMLPLWNEGYTTSEIAAQLGCSRWKVRRILDRIETQLRKRLAGDFGA